MYFLPLPRETCNATLYLWWFQVSPKSAAIEKIDGHLASSETCALSFCLDSKVKRAQRNQHLSNCKLITTRHITSQMSIPIEIMFINSPLLKILCTRAILFPDDNLKFSWKSDADKSYHDDQLHVTILDSLVLAHYQST